MDARLHKQGQELPTLGSCTGRWRLMLEKASIVINFTSWVTSQNHEVDIESAHHDPSIYSRMLTDRVEHAQHPIISILVTASSC